MSVPYVIRQRKNPQNLEAEGLYYPSSAYFGEVDLEDIASDICISSSLSEADVLGVVRAVLTAIPKYILLGYKVRLENLGIFKLGISASGQGKATADEVSFRDIKGTKILFSPDVKLQKSMSKVSYVRKDGTEETVTEDSDKETETA